MIGAGASEGACRGDVGVVTGSTVIKWLSLAAAPTFAIMVLGTVVFDNGMPNTFCAAGGSLWPDGMAPMYSLMAAFHLAPWLTLISRRGNAAQYG